MREYPDADGVYMQYNKWRTVSVIERIEKASDKPVVANTQAWTWKALHRIGMREPIAGLAGRRGMGRVSLTRPAATARWPGLGCSEHAQYHP